MPWCDTCDRFYNPNSLAVDGTCKNCGSFIASPDDEPDEEHKRAPWHFYVLVVAIVGYLGWRFVQLIGWVIAQF